MNELTYKTEKVKIGKLTIDSLDYSKTSKIIEHAIKNNKKTSIAYANTNTFNIVYHNKDLLKNLNFFSIIHPDGIGIFLASRFLYGRNGFKFRFTGSDFYKFFFKQIIQNQWRVFLFGDSEATLKKAISINPDMKIVGSQDGYSYLSKDIIKKINDTMPDVLIVGLPTPYQEKFVSENISKINSKVIICVGEGIKVLAGTKIRGPVILRKVGFEWMSRFVSNPVKHFKRYIIGIPLFLFRIFKLKIS